MFLIYESLNKQENSNASLIQDNLRDIALWEPLSNRPPNDSSSKGYRTLFGGLPNNILYFS